MGASEIDAVRALLSEMPRPVGWADRRARLDEVGSIWPVADDVTIEAVDLAGVVAAAAGFVLGFMMARYREIFFAMLGLAQSMILYGILVRSAAPGSTDGFNLSPPSFFSFKVGVRQSRVLLYSATASLAFCSAMALHRFVGSHAGVISQAILTNEIRVEYLGASVTRVLHLVYVIGAAMGGLGGALVALATGHIDPAGRPRANSCSSPSCPALGVSPRRCSE